MKNLASFKFEVPQGDACRQIEFRRPEFKTIKFATQYIQEKDPLGAGMALAENTIVGDIAELKADPMEYAAVCKALYQAVFESMPSVKIEDCGKDWKAEIEGVEEAVKIAKPSIEVIKLASKAANTAFLLAGECLLVDGLPADSEVRQDGIVFAALAMDIYRAFDLALPKIKRVGLGER